MPGRIQWPEWPEFHAPEGIQKDAEELRSYKKKIIDEYGEESLRKGWLKTCENLKQVTDSIAEKGTLAIPKIEFDELKKLSDARREQLKDAGCFVIRNVIERDLVNKLFSDLKNYVDANGDKIGGWPEETKAVKRLYWSPTQQALRAHPNQLFVQRTLNSWWKTTSPDVSPEPLSYADGVRIRPPGVPFFTLGPHIDAGSLSRWADEKYHKVYDSIFKGEPDKHNPYDLDVRKDTIQDLFEGNAHSSVFRAFQGWTALTKAGAREGSILLYPDVKTVIAYLILRPFFKPPTDTVDEMDASKWTLDTESSWFPGTTKPDSQRLSSSSHPHLRLKECLVNIPTMYPGDTMCHAVEVEHSGDSDSSVAYIAATPTTPANIRYIKGQLKSFLAGMPLEDYPAGSDETKLVGYLGEKGIPSEAGRKAMGFEL
ncbi:MAG: hypothetical protein M1834_009245 [Cirrosporium novae-zelandiae]|nr:MAG: hypothetical protein M1834_009245 [Cirrosporium novae-zelandiae]